MGASILLDGGGNDSAAGETQLYQQDIASANNATISILGTTSPLGGGGILGATPSMLMGELTYRPVGFEPAWTRAVSDVERARRVELVNGQHSTDYAGPLHGLLRIGPLDVEGQQGHGAPNPHSTRPKY